MVCAKEIAERVQDEIQWPKSWWHPPEPHMRADVAVESEPHKLCFADELWPLNGSERRIGVEWVSSPGVACHITTRSQAVHIDSILIDFDFDEVVSVENV